MSRRLLGVLAFLGCAVTVMSLQVGIATAGVRAMPDHPQVASLTTAPSGLFLPHAAGDPPAVPTPPWWHGVCDSGYNKQFKAAGSWDGLIACNPGGLFRLEKEAGSPLPSDWEWQCTELSKRAG